MDKIIVFMSILTINSSLESKFLLKTETFDKNCNLEKTKIKKLKKECNTEELWLKNDCKKSDVE